METKNGRKAQQEEKKSQINRKDVVIGVLLLLIAFFGTFGVFSIMRLALGTDYPMVVVVSDSMKPTIHRGDLLIVEGVEPAEINAGTIEDKTGDIIIFDSRGVWPNAKDEPIVHRVVDMWEEDGEYLFITKGDNNPDVDPPGFPNPVPLPGENILGRVTFIVPRLGYIKIWLSTGNIGYYIIGFLAILLVISIIQDILHPEEDEEDINKSKSEIPEERDTQVSEKDSLDSQRFDMGV